MEAHSSDVPAADAAAQLYPDDVPQDPIDNSLVPPPEPEPGSDEQKPPEDASDEPYALSMPDGVEVDAALLTTATPVLREAGISQDQAQKLVPLVAQVQERLTQQQNEEFDGLKAYWTRQARADSMIGGANWKETIRLCGVALDAAGAKMGGEFRALMDESGVGNHPAVLRVFRYFGQQIERSGAVTKPRASTGEQRLYPND